MSRKRGERETRGVWDLPEEGKEKVGGPTWGELLKTTKNLLLWIIETLPDIKCVCTGDECRTRTVCLFRF